MSLSISIQQARAFGAMQLASAHIETAQLDSDLLLAHVMQMDRLEVLLNPLKTLSDDENEAFKVFINRRMRHEPVAYLRGYETFMERSYRVNPDVLIPRPETEMVVLKALEMAQSNGPCTTVIDVCTGSGCIAISLALAMPDAIVYAVDISDKALTVAKENAKKLGAHGRVRFAKGDLLKPCSDLSSIDMIVSNPPYIAAAEMPTLPLDVRNFEPTLALKGRGQHGVGHYGDILKQARPILRNGGLVIFEIGASQRTYIEDLPRKGYCNPEFFKDLAGHDRIAVFIKG